MGSTGCKKITLNIQGMKKKPEKDVFICYCFEHTRGDIEADFLKNGRSLIMERIAAEKKQGACQCATRNPKGR